MFSFLKTLLTNIIIGIFFLFSPYLLWTTWNTKPRYSRRVLMRINTWFIIWRGHEYIWVLLCQILFFIRHCQRHHQEQLLSRSIFPPLKYSLSESNYVLEETLNKLKNIKLKSYPRRNVADLCTLILIDDDRLERDGIFKF